MSSDATLGGLVADGVVDAELGALLWLCAERGVPLVVASSDLSAARRFRAAIAALVPPERGAADVAVPGGTVLAGTLEGVLARLGAAPGSDVPTTDLPDDARDVGIVVTLDAEAPQRVASAHYVRPVERDAGGHLQRRPPALLSARDARSGRLDHFYWGITDELATRAGMERAGLEDAHVVRTGLLADAVAAGSHDEKALIRQARQTSMSSTAHGPSATDARH